MSFLNNINSSIGDQMRFVRDYQANPDKYKVPPKPPETPPGQDPFAQMIHPMMMMMMFMMMMKMMETMGVNPGSFPGFPGFPPGLPPGWPPVPVDPPVPGEPPISNNPAYKFIQELLKNGGAPAPGTPNVDFASNDSLLKRINELLDKAGDPEARQLFSQIQTMDPAANDAQAKLDALTERLKAKGLNDKELQELHLLIGAFTTNTVLAALEQIRTLLPDPQLEARINDLKKMRDGFAAEWKKLYPPTQNQPPADITQDVTQALELGKFTEEELGQALKYMLDKAPAEQLPVLRKLLTSLFDNGTLNPVPFLSENYLSKLSDDGRKALLDSLTLAGVLTKDGQSNSRLLGHLLQALNRDGSPETQAFAKDLTQRWFERYKGVDENNPGKQAFKDFLNLANITVKDGKLVFPGDITDPPEPAPVLDIAGWKKSDSNRAIATTFYQNILDRNPENQEVVNGWADHIAKNGLASALKGFFNSTEFKNKKLSVEDTVEKLYESIMGRHSDAGGKAHWVEQIKSGKMTLNQVIDAFLASPEFKQKA